MALKPGERVREKKSFGEGDPLEGSIESFHKWGGKIMVIVKLDEPISCGCGRSCADKMIDLAKNWERVPVQ